MLPSAVKNKILAVLAAVVALTLVVGGAYAASPDRSGARLPGKKIEACVNIKTGKLRVVEAGQRCATRGTEANPKLRERRVVWNKRGVQGKRGLQGVAGQDGAPGADGEDGANGVDGLDGVDGENGADGVDGAPGPQGDKGAQGDQGPAGEKGEPGERGPIGPAGADGADGDRGPVGPAGPAGPMGPAGPSGGGSVLEDGQGRTIGVVDSVTRGSVSVITSEGYFFTIRWDGSVATAQAYYTGAECTGDAYLNSGGAGVNPLYAKTLVYLGSADTLAVPAELDATRSAPNTGFTSASIDNPACGSNAGSRNGWKLQPVSATDVGLPAGTTNRLVPPLSLN